jgi:hypothetical protein
MSDTPLFPEIVESQPMQVATPTPMHLIQMALAKDLDLDKLERLISLQRDSDARIAEAQFHAALSIAQSEIGRVATDAKNSQTGSKYATYAALDRAIRPVYTRNGFGLSFSSGEATAETVNVYCKVSHSGGHVETYMITMPCDGKGARGNDVMTRTHAMGSAMSYGMRYLLKMIFNVVIGEDDDDGNGASEAVAQFATCGTVEEVQKLYAILFKQAQGSRNAKLMLAVTDAKDRRRREIENA